LNHVVGALQQRLRDPEADTFAVFMLMTRVNFRRLPYRQIGGFDTLQDVVDEDCRAPPDHIERPARFCQFDPASMGAPDVGRLFLSGKQDRSRAALASLVEDGTPLSA
jgi:hypothetical protein